MDQDRKTLLYRDRSGAVGYLLLATLLAALSSCGKVRDDAAGDTGSETHWLTRCDADIDCGEGSCECGLCTRSCLTAVDCAPLDVPGVECLAAANACGAPGTGASSSSPEAICSLACTRDADCAALGDPAVCRSQRCELPRASIETGGVGGAASNGAGGSSNGAGGSANATEDVIPELCDGSEGMRIAYVTGGGFVDTYYGFLSGTYGQSFFAIDGQCRFWQGRASDGWVYAGTLEATAAQAFAIELGYGHLAQYSAFLDDQCPDGPAAFLWTPEGTIGCGCGCTTNPDAAEGWRNAFRAVSTSSMVLFESGQPVTGPAQLALIPIDEVPVERTPQPWPLERAPAAEILDPAEGGFPLETSGALIEAPAELVSLRALRDAFGQQVGFGRRSSVSWVDPDTDQPRFFDFLLRDEVPVAVRAALRTAQGLP